MPLLVLDLTHSIAAAATLRVVQSIPYILFGAPAGATEWTSAGSSDRAARIIGPTLGGFAIAAVGGVSAMWIAALETGRWVTA